MAGIEIFLQGDETLDMQIGVLGGLIDDTLTQFRDSNPHHEPINPAVYKNERILHIANVFAIIAGARTSTEAEVASKAALLARDVVMVLYGDDVTLAPIDTVVGDEVAEEDVARVIANEAERYRLNRPNLSALIQKYYKDIDPEESCKEVVEDVISLVCMLAERADAQQRADAWLEDL